jgi:hypothetical protein
VKKEDVDVDVQNFTEEQDMHEDIVLYRDLYCEDLAHCLGINEDVLPPALSIAALLNPMFGDKSRIVGSGLMTKGQYNTAEADLLQRMHDILDRNNPIHASSSPDSSDSDGESSSSGSGGGSSSEEDEKVNVLTAFNSNHLKAREELALMLSYRDSKHMPKRLLTLRFLWGPKRRSRLAKSSDGGRICHQAKTLLTISTSVGGWIWLHFTKIIQTINGFLRLGFWRSERREGG